MKKILFFVATFVAFSFATSCSNSATQSNNGADTTSVDSVNVDSASVADSVSVDSTASVK